MKRRGLVLAAVLALPLTASCAPKDAAAPASAAAAGGQATMDDKTSQPTIARIASDSKDHTTLTAALKAVNWLDALANPGPFTVFAPVNAAFDKLPAGTVETLLKPENSGQLRTILLHHVMVSAYEPKDLTDGATLSTLDGGPLTVKRQGDAISIDGANVVASVKAGNGMVYVIDAVLLPKPAH